MFCILLLTLLNATNEITLPFNPRQRTILFAHSKLSEQSVWYNEQYWEPFVQKYQGKIQMIKMDDYNSTVLCVLDIKAFPVVRLIYNNTFGRVIQLNMLSEIVKYKFKETQMPPNLATFFTNYTLTASKICTYQVELSHNLESFGHYLENLYARYRKQVPFRFIYVVAHDIPIVLFTFYFITKKILHYFK